MMVGARLRANSQNYDLHRKSSKTDEDQVRTHKEKMRGIVRKIWIMKSATVALAPSSSTKMITGMVFQGGGTKGIVYGGAIQRFEQEYPDGALQHVKKFAGTSAGSQTAALLASGYTGKDLANIAKNEHWKDLVDHSNWLHGGTVRDVYGMVSGKFGYSEGAHLRASLDKFIAAKSQGKAHITFEDHYKMHGTELVMGVVNLKTRRFEYLSRHTVPDMPVSLACRASSAVPVVYTPVRWPEDDPNGAMYVDGGLVGNLPLDSFYTDAEKETTVAFTLCEGAKEQDQTGVPRTFADYLAASLNIMMDQAQNEFGMSSSTQEAELNKRGIKLVTIDTKGFGMLDKQMPREELEALISSGYDSVSQFFGKDPERGREIYYGEEGVDTAKLAAASAKPSTGGYGLVGRMIPWVFRGAKN